MGEQLQIISEAELGEINQERALANLKLYTAEEYMRLQALYSRELSLDMKTFHDCYSHIGEMVDDWEADDLQRRGRP